MYYFAFVLFNTLTCRFLAAIRASLSEYNNYLVDEHEDDEPIQVKSENWINNSHV